MLKLKYRASWITLFGILVILPLFQLDNCIAQSLIGTSGLVTIPTAEIQKDREVSFGSSWINKEQFGYGKYEYDGLISFATIGYLPFLEVSLRLTRKLGLPDREARIQALGDRMISVKLMPLVESKFLPSIVLGAHDILWSSKSGRLSNNFSALYLSTSKSIYFAVCKIQFNLGYGVDWIDARNQQFIGFFGGVSVSPIPSITLMLEHDTEKINCGIQVSLFDHIQLRAAFLDLDAFSGGVGYKFKL